MDVASGLRSGAGDFEDVAGDGAQETFGEVGAAGIAGAEDEDEGFHEGEGSTAFASGTAVTAPSTVAVR
jgi:hypothetical protein